MGEDVRRREVQRRTGVTGKMGEKNEKLAVPKLLSPPLSRHISWRDHVTSHAMSSGVTDATQSLHAGTARGRGLAWHVLSRRNRWRDSTLWLRQVWWRDQRGQI